MSRFAVSAVAAITLLCGTTSPRAAAAGPYDDLLRYAPPTTNTLVLVNVKAAFNSPLAKRDRWADDYVERFRSGIGFVPPNADRVVIASHVNLSSLARTYQVGLIRLATFPTAEELAQREGGTISQMANEKVVLSSRDVYFVTLPGVMGVVYPADRQAASRWIRHARASEAPAVSDYLRQAAEKAGDNVLTIALDLTDVPDPALLKIGLTASPTVVRLQPKGLNVDALTRVLASVRGLTFSVQIRESITGTLRLDFGVPSSPFKNVARELFLEMLGDHGVLLPGMEQWTVTNEDTSITLTGPMTRSDLRQVLSLFSYPGDMPDEAPKGSPGEVSVPTTKRYLSACDVLLEELSGKKDDKDYTKTATWYDTAANRLDHLSRNGVDPLASNAAAESAKQLRAIAGSLRGVPITKESLQKQAYYRTQPTIGASVSWWGVQPIWLGQRPADTNYPQIREKWEKTIADDQVRRTEAWSQINQIMGEAKRKLADKYPGKF